MGVFFPRMEKNLYSISCFDNDCRTILTIAGFRFVRKRDLAWKV
jgi:hypothetical protein